jgi:hypothetical protein
MAKAIPSEAAVPISRAFRFMTPSDIRVRLPLQHRAPNRTRKGRCRSFNQRVVRSEIGFGITRQNPPASSFSKDAPNPNIDGCVEWKHCQLHP